MRSLRLAIVSSEATPFAKTGGLADVASALTRALHARGHDVRLFLPLYPRCKQVVEEAGGSFESPAALEGIKVGDGVTVSVRTAQLPDSEARVWFIDCPELFSGDELYAGDESDALRFAILSRATLHVCQYTGWSPEIVHANDWHAALIPIYLRTLYGWDELFENTKTLLSIHNIGYQGKFSSEIIRQLGLADVKDLFYQADLGEGFISFLKSGLLYASMISTVSRTYADEIQTPEQGMGLEDLLRLRSSELVGIVNGVDYGEWNPATDPHLAANYSADDISGKLACKRALCEEVGLEFDESAPVIGVVSRLTGQKGFELLPDALPVLFSNENVRFVALGSGEKRLEDYFRWLEQAHPGKAAFRSGYNEGLSHRIEAGSDVFLMPSRYEPCGLNQMYSLKYGTVPLVRSTGGLADTVEPFNPEAGTGTGFAFTEFSSHALLRALHDVMRAWKDSSTWSGLVQRGMSVDFSWERQVAEYEELYESMLS